MSTPREAGQQALPNQTKAEAEALFKRLEKLGQDGVGNYGMPICAEAAAELRRLHEAHEWQYKMAGDRLRRIEKLEAVNAELLKALNNIEVSTYDAMTAALARAAIAKAEGQT